MVDGGVVPLTDLAYPGLGSSRDEDVVGVRAIIDQAPETLVALACSKSFGLYRERTGVLLATTRRAVDADPVRRTLTALARLLWSNPPDHRAAIVRCVLEDATLRAEWRREIEAMRRRLVELRQQLAATKIIGANSRPTGRQESLYTLLPLSPAAVETLRTDHCIYVDLSGRINISGLNSRNVDRFIDLVSRSMVQVL